MSAEPTPQDRVTAIRSALSKAPPYFTGISELTEFGGHLYYRGTKNEPGFIDLANATEAELKSLAEACTPATFGRNDMDVYDETYRKARQMDTSFFSTKFDPVFSGIIDAVREQLRGGSDDPIRAELYKLNVYDRGSFFKTHRDTPRQKTMFGSLVVAFPTTHEGGNLLLRRADQQWTFDAQQRIANSTNPSVAFVAFYSDIEHEVEVVSSGHRVTLTYNLYYGAIEDTANNALTKVVYKRTPDEELIRSTISSYLEGRTQVLPDGGYLGFGLSYKYPLPRSYDRRTPLTTLPLKGSDEILWRVLESLSLKPSIRMFIKGQEFDVLVPNVPNAEWFSGVDTTWEYYFSDEGVIVHKYGDSRSCRGDSNPEESDIEESDLKEKAKKIIWVTPSWSSTRMKEPYVAYGNESQLDYFYADACMIAQVQPLVGDVLEPESEKISGKRESREESSGEELSEDVPKKKRVPRII
ncbi:hypothetical protein AX16_002286 [Volvariella volvacea WC 439]|nr:hypothetical protein AX16_002286 [Volvariella volvacea WC 439]